MTTSLEVFEQIATDAAEVGNAGRTISTTGENTWGGHHGRICVTSTGEIYHARITVTGGGSCAIRKRSVGGTWSDVVTLQTYDASHMLIDPRDDAIYLTVRTLANVWYVYSSRDNFVTGAAIPGDWAQLLAGTNFYGGVGIDSDGLLVFKCEFGNTTTGLNPTLAVTTPAPITTFDKLCEAWFMTGKYNLTTLQWEWGVPHKYQWGTRKAYDYLFVNPAGRPRGTYGMAQSHGRYDSEGYLLQAGWGFIFNGFINYSFDPDELGSFKSRLSRIADPLAATRADVAGNYLTNRPHDQLIDVKGRRFTTRYIQNDVWGGKADGLYLSVFDKNDRQIDECVVEAASSVGSTKLWEDRLGRVYLLHLYTGASAPVFVVYKVVEGVSSVGISSFSISLSNSFNLSSSIGLKCPQSWAMSIACNRVGNARADKLHMSFNFRHLDYPTGLSDATGTQRCYYGRIAF